MHASPREFQYMNRSRKRWLPALLPAALLAACAPAASTESCELASEPLVLISEENRLLQYWVEEARPVYFGDALPSSSALADFREAISRSFDTDPHVLLENQLRHVDGGDAENVRLALTGEAGTIREMRCLEGILLSVQTERAVRKGTSMFETPTEFTSYILTKPDSLKIYFYTVDQPGIGGMGVLDEPIARDQEEGWVVVESLHNHNFFPASDALLGGTVPGAGDMRYMRSASQRYGLSTATITNGFHTIEMSRADFAVFRAE
jgi:hypothetical protein